MGAGSHRKNGRRLIHAFLGWMIATSIVTVAIVGPPLTRQSSRPMIELRHDVLMIDRELERWSLRTHTSSRPADGLVDLNPARSTDTPTNVLIRGDLA